MDKHPDRLGFAVIAFSIVSFVLLLVNSTMKPTLNTMFDNLKTIPQSKQMDVTVALTNQPNPNDPKWVNKGTYGSNGSYVADDDGNYVIYAIDPAKPITITSTPTATTNNNKIATIKYVNKVVASGSINGMFTSDSNLKSIEGLNLWDTQKVTNMSTMFYNTSSLTSIDLSTFDTTNVTDMSAMFAGASSLKTIDVSTFNTSNVKSMASMFFKTHFSSLNIDNFNTSKVTNMSAMFCYSSFDSLDLSHMDTQAVTNMTSMLFDTNIKNLNISNINFSSVTLMPNFLGLAKITNIELNNITPASKTVDSNDWIANTTIPSDLIIKLKSAIIPQN